MRNVVLVAHNVKGKIFSMTGEWTKESLFSLKENETFQCPSCKQPVLLRIGNQRIPHFAHVKASNCQAFSEAESTYHLEGKIQLYNWLNHQSYSPKLEPYFKQLKQRPDLFVLFNHSSLAIEYQCSTIDANRFKERTENYMVNGYQPLWILGGKRLKRLSNNQFTLSTFDWMFTRLMNKKPCLLYYCSETKKFLLLHHLVPLTTNKVVADLEVISPQDISINDLLSRNLDTSFPMEEWLEMKTNWRLNCTQFPSHSMKKLLHYLYNNHKYPSLLPSEVGVPVPSMYWIQTSPLIWQAWILLELIDKLPVHSTFSFQDVYHFFNMKKRSQLFYLRDLPLISTSHYSFAIMEYLNRLVDFGMLVHINKKTFKKIRDCHFPTNLEEAIKADQLLLLGNKRKYM
jgi:competence protein CoiA